MSPTPFEVFRASMLLYAKRQAPRLARLVDSATTCIEAAKYCERPYVAVSGGKDSTLLLHLVTTHLGRQLALHNDEWSPLETIHFLDQLEARYAVTITRLRCKRHLEYERLMGVPLVLSQPVRVDAVCDGTSQHYQRLHYDGVWVGVRKDESVRRLYWLAQGKERYLKARQIWRFAPLADWTWRDIWAYTFAHDLPVNPAYIRLINIGIAPEKARVGGLSIVRVAHHGHHLIEKQLFPDDWNAFVQANPVMRRFA